MVLRALAAAAIVGAAMAAGCSKADTALVPAGPPADPSTLGIVAGQFPGPMRGALAVLSPRGSEPLPPPASTPVMDQVQLQFIPDMLIARVGFPVSFHSTDSELHNINVRKPGKRMVRPEAANSQRWPPAAVASSRTPSDSPSASVICEAMVRFQMSS